MATKFQIKRTSVSGRTPNTTNSANSSYIAAGELALNLTDKKMYSSNGTNYFEIGSFKVELVNSTSNVSTFTEISTLQFDEDSGFDVTNPSSGIAKVAINSTFKFWQVDGVQKLTAAGLDTVNFIGGNNISITANGANTPQSIAFATSMTPTFTSVTFGNSTVNTTINSSAIAVSKIFANGVVGTAGKVLTANGTGGIYWGDAASGGGSGDLTIISDTFNGNGSNTVFTLSVTTTTDKTFVYLNGVLQTPTTDYSVANTTLTFITAPPSDNVIEVRTFDIPSVADLTVTSDNFTGNGSNTQFTLTTSLSSDQTSLVFLNGVAQVPTTDYTISGSTLTFTAAPANGTNIQVTSFTAEDISTTTYTGNGSNTEFTLGTTSTTSKTIVTLNGVTQTPVTDYSVSGATLVFAVAPANNDKIVARSIPSTASSTAGGNTHIQYNKSGSLGGSAGFTFNETTNNVTIANTLTVPNLRINASNPPANSTSTGSTGTVAWDSDYLYVAVGTDTWKKTPITTDGAGGGGGSPGGSNTHIQYNDSNTFNGSAAFTFNEATNTVTLSNTLAIGSNVTVNTSTIFIGNSSVNTTITAGNVHLQGTQLTVGNVVLTGEQITIGNSTVNTVFTANSFGLGMARQSFAGNGSNTQFTLSSEPTNESHTLVFVDRVIQRDSDYNIAGAVLTFTSAPDNGSDIDVYVARAGVSAVAPARGSNTNIIFNDSAESNGSAGFTFNKTTNNVTISNTLSVGNSTVNTTIRPNGATFSGDLMPSANVTYDIGNSSMRWRDLWLSGSTINLGGASIKTDTDTGAIALIPKPTDATPNPVAMVVSPTGGITSVPTTGGVPAANAVAEAAESNTAAPVPIDITSTAPANGQALIWSSAANTFVPGNVAAGGASSDIPKITGLVYPGNDTAANTSGGQTVYISGSNFAANCVVYINGSAAPSVSFISSSNVGFTTPALSANVYPVYVINPGDGATAIHIPGLNVSGVPNWSTAAGSLGDADAESAWSFNVSATSDSSVTYTLAGGSSLPSGITLASNGLISGTLSSPPASETTYNFSIVATDGENQDASRSFSVSVTVGDPYFYLTTLLIHADGTNNQNNHTFLDSSDNNLTITRAGNASQGALSPFSQTGWSAYFDGSGDYIRTSGNVLTGAGNVTIECWVYPESSSVIGMFDGGPNQAGIIRNYPGNTIAKQGQDGTGATFSLTQNQWSHFAVTFSGGVIKVYVNGVNTANGTYTGDYSVGTNFDIGGINGTGDGAFKGYISNFRVTKSVVYSNNFTPSTTPLTAIANTTLLTCNANRFIDGSTNNYSITRNGDTKVIVFSPFKPSAAYSTANVGGSAYFDGTGDYLIVGASNLTATSTGKTPLTVGAGDFTIEGWFKTSNVSSSAATIFKHYASPGTNDILEIRLVTNTVTMRYRVSGGVEAALTSGTITTDQWYHIAFVRNSGVVKGYLNGVEFGSANFTGNLATTLTTTTIGCDQSGTSIFTGELSNFRFVKGTAVYTSAFTPSTTPLTNIANTSLLLNFTNAGIFDQTARNVLETVGDAKVSTAQYKYGTGSIALDGTGDYLSIAANPLLAFGSGDFTIEFWFRGTDGAGNLIGITTNASGNWNLVLASSLLYWQSQYATTNLYNNSAAGILDGNWHHIAITRASGSNRMFFDGVLQGSATSDNTVYAAAHAMQIGSSGSYGDIAANIDDLRITRGYARYTSNFTPPTSAFKNR